MRRFASLLILGWVVCGCAASALGGESTIRPDGLLCESQARPLSVDVDSPLLRWRVEAVRSSARGLRQSGYRILVATSEDKLAAAEGDVWDSHRVNSSATQVEYRGMPLLAEHTYYWKVQSWDQVGVASEWSAAGEWTMGLDVGGLKNSAWKAKWIAAAPDTAAPTEAKDAGALPIFRRAFSLPTGVRKAVVRISGLGQYELRINGGSVNENTLAPGWTDYRKRVFYNTIDVTRLVHAGENALGVLLGNGMYNVAETPGRYQKFSGSMGQPKLIAQLSVTLEDGTRQDILSDGTWTQTPGPITFSSTYGGEDFDARREPAGWDAAGFADDGWKAAVEVDGPGGRLMAEPIPAVRALQVFSTAQVTEPRAGAQVYDLGQNFSGWPAMEVQGARGDVVKLIPGELLDEQGLVSQKSSGEPVWFAYTLRGSGKESWHPRFSYYGFRYVQVEVTPAKNAAAKPAILRMEGQFVHAAVTRSGEFASSSEQMRRIHNLILAAVDSNLHSVLTDCPHREKLGWLEQTHLQGKSLMSNYDLSQFYAKTADDMQDAQLASGLVPDIAPEYVQFERGFRDSPEWGSAAILAPWLAYQQYGDSRILKNHYEMMKRYADYLESQAKDGVVSHGLGDWYDIGPGEPGESKLTGRGLTATAIYYQDLTVLRQVATLLAKPEDERLFLRRANQVRAVFNAKLFHPVTHQYDTGSQTANAMPLVVGLVPESERRALLAHLVDDIRQRKNHVTAGDIGFHYVVTALMEGGRSDVLFDMISRNDTPSYGYQLAQGATSLTEAWDTNPKSSQNHFMLGHIEEWFHRGLAGLNIDFSRPAAERIVIRPAVVGDVTWARDSQESVLGRIVADWKLEQGKFVLHVTIPANASATVYLPVTAVGPVTASVGARRSRLQAGSAVYVVGSGEYQFEAPLHRD